MKICKICGNNLPRRGFKDGKLICTCCRNKIESELPKYLNNKNQFKIIENYKNLYIIIEYKELYFVYFKCKNCNKWFLKYYYPYKFIDKIKENNNLELTCSHKCADELKGKPGFCKNCGIWNEKRNSATGYGLSECNCGRENIENNQKPGKCSKCGKFNNKRSISALGLDGFHDFDDRGCECGIKQRKDAQSKGIKINLQPGICTNPNCDCYNKERDQNGRGKDIGYGDGEWIANHDIIDKNTNKIIVYKGQKCGCNCSQKWYTEHNNEDNMIEHSKSNLNKLNECYIKFCDNCGEETVHNGFGNCLICNPNTRSIKRLIKKDNVLLYWDSTIGKYVNWEIYIKNFKLENINIDFLKEVRNIYDNAEIIKTFRKQNSNSWLNAKIPFEQSLLDKNIKYFTYIKFYLNENNISLPLVAGSSASKSVNITGSDVNFSTDINDGPSRRFLKENNYKWDKTKILIIPFDNKNDSLLSEQLLKDKFNLFGS